MCHAKASTSLDDLDKSQEVQVVQFREVIGEEVWSQPGEPEATVFSCEAVKVKIYIWNGIDES